jgi:hypothetical protein
MNMSENVRIMPMPVPHPIWKEGEGGYPKALKVSFSDGKVRTYNISEQVEQPPPHVCSTEELNRLFRENTYGGYRPRHAKK